MSTSPTPLASWDELNSLILEGDACIAAGVAENFAAVIPDLPREGPDKERRAELRRALGIRAPEWAVELAVINGSAAFEGEAGELLLCAVTTALFTDRGPVLRRLATYLLSRGVDRFVVLALLYGWATHFCAPVPFEGEVVAVFEEALEGAS